MIIPMTTIEVNSDFRVKIEPSKENNLGIVGFVMIGLGEYIGHIDDKYINQIENALLKFIGVKR